MYFPKRTKEELQEWKKYHVLPMDSPEEIKEDRTLAD
jgi:hypothetical protein